MARLWEESFEDLNFVALNRYTYNSVPGYALIPTTQTYGDGSYCLNFTNNLKFYHTLPSTYTETYMAQFLSTPDLTAWHTDGDANSFFFGWYKGSATPLMRLAVSKVTRKMTLYLGSDMNTKVAEGRVLDSNHQYHLELRYHMADAGHVQTWIDGGLDINYSGDTKPGADADFDTFYFNATNSVSAIIDTIVINDTSGGEDNGRIGVYHMWSAVPAANSATNNSWGKSTGSNGAALCDERPANLDTDYVFSVVNGEKQGFTFGAIAFPDNTVIHEVIDIHVPRKVTEGQMKLGMRGGSPVTETETAALDLPTSYATMRYRRTTDPHGDAWTPTTVNAAESLVESVIA